jgi:hypothetical protein
LAVLDAITDTGPFIHLDEIKYLELLPVVFKTIIVPEQVTRELSSPSARSFIENNLKSIIVEPVQDEALFTAKNASSGFRLHLADLAIMVNTTRQLPVLKTCNSVRQLNLPAEQLSEQSVYFSEAIKQVLLAKNA